MIVCSVGKLKVLNFGNQNLIWTLSLCIPIRRYPIARIQWTRLAGKMNNCEAGGQTDKTKFTRNHKFPVCVIGSFRGRAAAATLSVKPVYAHTVD